MRVHTANRYLGRVTLRPTVAVWVISIALFGIGDTATTLYFIHAGVGVEGNALVAPMLEAAGIWILVPWKAAAIVLFYGGYRLVPDDVAIGVPIGLALLGAFLTGWNTLGAYLGYTPLPIF